MMKRITLSHIPICFLLTPAVDSMLDGERLDSSPKFSRILNLDSSYGPFLSALICSFLFVTFFSIYVRYCSNSDQVATGNQTGTSATADCSSSSRQGIDPKLLDTFPILAYSSIKRLRLDDSSALECAVCLSELNHHDLLRLLPICNHVFHPQCIDAWLGSHVTCPVCRSRLTPEHHDGGDNDNGHDVVIVIPEEVNSQHELDESSASSRRTEFNSGERSLGRSHSTGHSLSLVETVGKDMERYTLRLSEDMRKYILANHRGMRRSASYDVFGPGRRPGEVKFQIF
ncbi:hypothetical protein K1719_028340 [Acacia pycnantha]|nr:hypothetical protein K1719_028340 [Acacia pycnantha]